uniref:Replication-associated protein n=1 Tax=Cressdnaviricota sp. TaxID=2748378 RepID=A0A6M9Z729_9VIRU|nr:MAG: replication-associated protein [Cressdnaviricota sp.]
MTDPVTEPAVKQLSSCRAFCFTLQLNAPDEWQVPDPLPEKLQYLVYQLETSPTTGKLHAQGYLEWKSTVRVSAVVTALQMPRTPHMEKRNGTREQARAYCMKEETRLAGTTPKEYGEWRTGTSRGAKNKQALLDLKAYVLDPETVADLSVTEDKLRLEDKWLSVYNDCPRAWEAIFQEFHRLRTPGPSSLTLRPWQEYLLGLFETPPLRRRIFWVWSHTSGTGKSTFVDYLARHPKWGPQLLVGSFALKDTLFMYRQGVHRIIALNMPRDTSDESMRFYKATLETLSDGGRLLSTKYQPREIYLNAHILVTSNLPPIYGQLPKRIVEINLDASEWLQTHLEGFVDIDEINEQLNLLPQPGDFV